MTIDEIMHLMPVMSFATAHEIRRAIELYGDQRLCEGTLLGTIAGPNPKGCEREHRISKLEREDSARKGLEHEIEERLSSLEEAHKGLLPSFIRGRIEECGGIGNGVTHEERLRALEGWRKLATAPKTIRVRVAVAVTP